MTSHFGDFEGLALKLTDTKIDARKKVSVLSEIRDNIEIIQFAELNNFVNYLLPTFIELLKNVEINFNSSSNEQRMRCILLEIMNRIPVRDETLRPVALDLQSIMINIIEHDNEENALIAVHIMQDLFRGFRSLFEDFVEQFSALVRKSLLWLPTMATDLLNQASATPILSPSAEVSSQPNRIITKASQSFRVMAELPMSIVIFFQVYRRSTIEFLEPLVLPAIEVIRYHHPIQQAAHLAAAEKGTYFTGVSPAITNRTTYNELLLAQVKTLSVLAYFMRAFPDVLSSCKEEFPIIVIRLLKNCAPEASATRKELFIAMRHMLSTDFGAPFAAHIEDLLDEQVLLGDGVTSQHHLRPVAFSFVADLVHHCRLSLTWPQIQRMMTSYSQIINDASLSLAMQTMGCKALASLTDYAAILSKVPEKQQVYQALLRLAELLIVKMSALRTITTRLYGIVRSLEIIPPELSAWERTPTTITGSTSSSNNAITSSSSSSSSLISTMMMDDSIKGKDKDISMKVSSDLTEETTGVANSNPTGNTTSTFPGENDASIEYVREVRMIFRGLLLALKNVTHCLVACQKELVDDKSLDPIDVDLYTDLFRDGLFCFDVMSSLFEEQLRSYLRKNMAGAATANPNVPATTSNPSVPANASNPTVTSASTAITNTTTASTALLTHPVAPLSKEEKECIDYFGGIFTSLPEGIFQDLLETNTLLFSERILTNHVLIFVAQHFFASPFVSRATLEIFFKFLMDHMEWLAEPDHQHASLSLRLFKMAFSAVNLFNAQNEIILRVILVDLITSCFKRANSVRDPIAYYQVLRSLFRSVSGGRYDYLYRDFLTLLPVLFPTFHRLFDMNHRKALRDLYIELALTVPVRLSALLPHISWLMRPIMIALTTAEGDLLNQGMRTLELCIDNLTPEFLEPILAPYYVDIIQGLCRHVRPPPYTHSIAAFRILGKLGGRNRRNLKDITKLPHNDLPDQCMLVECPFDHSTLLHLPFDAALEFIPIILTENYNTIERQHAFKFIETSFVFMMSHYDVSNALYKIDHPSITADSISSSNENTSGISTANATNNNEVLAFKVHDEVAFKKKLANEKIIEQLIFTLFLATTVLDLRERAIELVERVFVHFAFIKVAQADEARHELEPYFPGIRNPTLDEDVLATGLVRVLIHENREVGKYLGIALKSLYQGGALLLPTPHRPTSQSLRQQSQPSSSPLQQLFFFDVLANRFASCCYEREWHAKQGGCQGIHLLVNDVPLGSKWLCEHASKFFRALLYVLKDYIPETAAWTNHEAIRALNHIIMSIAELSNETTSAAIKPEGASTNMEVESNAGPSHQQQHSPSKGAVNTATGSNIAATSSSNIATGSSGTNNDPYKVLQSLIGYAVQELLNPITTVRTTVQSLLSKVADKRHTSLPEMMLPYKERLLQNIYGKNIRSVAIPIQTAHMDALALMVGLRSNMIPCDAHLVKFMVDILTMVEEEEDHYINTHNISVNATGSVANSPHPSNPPSATSTPNKHPPTSTLSNNTATTPAAAATATNNVQKPASSASKITLNEHRMAMLRLFSAMQCNPEYTVLLKTNFTDISNRMVMMFIRLLGGTEEDQVDIVRVTLKQIIAQGRLDKETMTQCLKPIFADWSIIQPRLMFSVRRLLALLPNCFNQSLGDRLMDVIKRYGDTKSIIESNSKPYQDSNDMRIMMSVLEVFPYLPTACLKLMPDYVQFIMNAEKAVHRRLWTSLRRPLIQYLTAHPMESIDFFLSMIHSESHSELLVSLIEPDPQGHRAVSLRIQLAKQSDKLLLKALPLTLTTEEDQDQVGELKDSMDSSDQKDIQIKSGFPLTDTHLHGLLIVKTLLKSYPDWVQSHPNVVERLFSLFELCESSMMVQLTEIKHLRTIRLLIECLYGAYYQPDKLPHQDDGIHVKMTLSLAKRLLDHTTNDYTCLRNVFRELAIHASMPFKMQVVLQFLQMNKDSVQHPCIYTSKQRLSILRYLMDPMIAHALRKQELNVLFDKVRLNAMAEHVWIRLADVTVKSASDDLRIDWLHLTATLIQHMATDVMDYRKDIIKFAWNHLKLEDMLVRATAHFLLAAFMDAFETPGKFVLPTFTELILSHQNEVRPIVRQALEILVPALPRRLPIDGSSTSSSTPKYDVCTRKMRRLLLEESPMASSSQAMAQITLVWQVILRHPDIFYDFREQFVPALVSSIQRINLSTSPEARKMTTDLIELIVSWELRRHRLSGLSVPMELESDDAIHKDKDTKEGSGGSQQYRTATPGMSVDPLNNILMASTPGSNSATPGSPLSISPDYRPPLIIMEMAANFLIRIAFSASDMPDKANLIKRCMDLLKEILNPTMWPDVQIKFDVFEKVLAKSFTSSTASAAAAAAANINSSGAGGAVTSNMICVALEVLLVIVESKPPSFVYSHAKQFRDRIEAILSQCENVAVVQSMCPLLGKLYQITNNYPLQPGIIGIIKAEDISNTDGADNADGSTMDTTEVIDTKDKEDITMDVSENPIDEPIEPTMDNVKKMKDNIMLDVRGLQSTIEELVQEKLTNGKQLYAALMYVKTINQIHPSLIDRYLSGITRVFQKLVRDHTAQSTSNNPAVAGATAAGVPSSTSSNSSGATSNTANISINAMTSMENDTVAKLLLLCMDILKLRIAHLGDQRRLFITALQNLLDKTNDVDIIKTIARLTMQWMSIKEESIPTLKEKASLIMKLIGLEKRVGQDYGLIEDYFDCILQIYADPSLLRTELTVRLEPAFLAGLMYQHNPKVRQRFFDVFHRSIGKTLYARLNYLLGIQNWESLANQFWLPVALDALLGLTSHTNPKQSLCDMTNYEKLLLSLQELRKTDERKDIGIKMKREETHSIKDKDAEAYKGINKDENASKDTMENNVDPTMIVEKHLKYLESIKSYRLDDLMICFRELLYAMPQLTARAWTSFFPIWWTSLKERERHDTTKIMISFFGKEYHARQSMARPNVIQVTLDGIRSSKPIIHLPSPLVKYLGKTFSSWYTSLDILHINTNNIGNTQPMDLLADDLKVQEIHLDAMADLYRLMADEDAFYGLWRERSGYSETNIALSYLLNGFWQKAQSVLEQAQMKARSGNTPFSEAEYHFWVDEWQKSSRKMQQWDYIYEFAKLASNNAELLAQCAWRLGDWTTEQDALVQVTQSNPELMTPRHLLYQGYCLMMQSQGQELNKITELQRLYDEAIQMCLRQWHQLPNAIGQTHIPLLELSQQLVEWQDSQQMMGVLHTLSTAVTNAASNSHIAGIAAGGNAATATNPPLQPITTVNQQTPTSILHEHMTAIQELRGAFGAWRERVPNRWDDIEVWSELFTWRQQMYAVANTTFQTIVNAVETTNSNASLAFIGYHEMAWSSNRLATIARKHRLPEVAQNSLGKIYTLPNIEIQDAYLKLVEQAKLHLDAHEFAQGVELINNTNLTFFSDIQKADFFTYKGNFLMRMGYLEDAHSSFALALQICDTHAKAWSSWAQCYEQLYREQPEVARFGVSAMTCLVNAVRHHSFERARRLLARIMWFLSFDHPESHILLETLEKQTNIMNQTIHPINIGGVAAAAGKQGGIHQPPTSTAHFPDQIPLWLWTSFVPQIIIALSRPEGAYMSAILQRLVKEYPQSCYFHIRANFLEFRERHHYLKQHLQSRTSTATPSGGNPNPPVPNVTTLATTTATVDNNPSSGSGSGENISIIPSVSSSPSSATLPSEGSNPTVNEGITDATSKIAMPVARTDLLSPDTSNLLHASGSGMKSTVGNNPTGNPAHNPGHHPIHQPMPQPMMSVPAAATHVMFTLQTCYELMQQFKNMHLLLSITLETLQDELQNKFRLNSEEDLYRILSTLLMDCYQQQLAKVAEATPMPEDDSVPGPLEASLQKLHRGIFNTPYILAKFKNAFHQDFIVTKHTCSSVLSKLREWRDHLRSELDRHVRHSYLDQYSRYLVELPRQRMDDVEVPGQYQKFRSAAHKDFITIERFVNRVDIIRKHGTAYRRITMRGSDGQYYPFLLQTTTMRYTRSEERISNIFRLLNPILERKVDTRRRHLQFSAPITIHIGTHLRMMEDDTSQVSLEDVYLDHCAREPIHIDAPIMTYRDKMMAVAAKAYQEKWSREKCVVENLNARLEILELVTHTMVPSHALTDYLARIYPSAQELWLMRKRFTLSFACAVFMSYCAFLNHRSPAKLHVSLSTGNVLMTENAFIMQQNEMQLENHEAVPFRLTPNIQHLMTQHGMDGTFVASLIALGRVLSQHDLQIEHFLALYFRDEFNYMQLCYPRNVPQSLATEAETRNCALQNGILVLKRMQVMGCVTKEDTAIPLGVGPAGPSKPDMTKPFSQPLLELIAVATSPMQLCQMDPTWHPWL